MKEKTAETSQKNLAQFIKHFIVIYSSKTVVQLQLFKSVWNTFIIVATTFTI